jgi:hypothetical protein
MGTISREPGFINGMNDGARISPGEICVKNIRRRIQSIGL